MEETMLKQSRIARCFAALIALLGCVPALADGVLQFGEIRLAVDEGDTGYVTVIRSGSANEAVSAILGVGVGGTAILGTDFEIDLPLGVVQIEAGDLFANVAVTAFDDGEREGTEFATLSLSSPSGATLGEATALTLDVIDAQQAPVVLKYSGDEIRRVSEGNDLPVDVVRDGEGGEASIVVSGQPGSATLGVDYSDVTQTLEFGETEGSKNFSLMTIEDNELEGNETLTLVIGEGEPTDRVVAGDRTRLVIIEDNEPAQPGEFTLEILGDSNVPESSDPLTFRVTRRDGSSGLVTVDYATADGTTSDAAIAGEHYVAITDRLRFEDGDTVAEFQVELIGDDDKGPATRFFFVYIVNPTLLSSVDPENSVVRIGRQEDDGVSDDDDDCPFLCNDLCFIATAAFGSSMDPHVASLRRFRDDILLRTTPGRAFVAAYYRFSPPVADVIARDGSLRALTRGALWPLVFTVENPVTVLTGLSLLLFGMNLRRRSSRRR
jgi:hypothetical protein